ncbi:MAG: proline--tRNA ligase [Candidatus Omnitrophica bacterium]|nr:proline--tRNA ligase [Candidatus Omnitrophota bacterium]
MRWSQLIIPTLKEVPAEAEVPSHVLLLRAGFIRKLFSGAYSYLPLGLRVLKKIERIIREEMDRAGGQEVLMPAVQPAELWEESGRFAQLGEDVFVIKDRKGRKVVLGPTHEEVITDIIRNTVRSYKDLPLLVYQIQTKFRDEARPRFGVIRSKEFIMKDAYSFDADTQGLERVYDRVHQAYLTIFSRLGIKPLVVEADPGMMGGKSSHEFMILSKSGEGEIAVCKACGYAAGLEVAACEAPALGRAAKEAGTPARLEEVKTPGAKTIEEVGKLLKITPQQMVKTLLYDTDLGPAAALVRGDHELNEIKFARRGGFKKLVMASPEQILKWTGGPLGFSGPVKLKGVRVIQDFAVSAMANFVTGANLADCHLKGVNAPRDYKPDLVADIRAIQAQDPCPRCKKPVSLEAALELGHIFKLMTKYTESMKAHYLDAQGKEHPIIMGCYGLGINRILAAIVELYHDKDGIRWPPSVSPFQVEVLPVNLEDPAVRATAEEIYQALLKRGVEVLIDDRSERAGAKFKDADLVGITTQIVVGPSALKEGKVEIKSRLGGGVKRLAKDELLEGLGKNEGIFS